MIDDDFLWLEAVDDPRSLAWVKRHNARTLQTLQSQPEYEQMYQEALSILTSKARLPLGTLRGQELHNFWQDDLHVRGVWRKASLDSYRSGQPQWQTVLDVDALAKAEKKNWVYKGVSCLPPANDRCIVNLSNGGTDAFVGREFSVEQGAFVEDGFVLPEGKNGRAWLDRDTLLVASDWGDGPTESGYPRELRMWTRGQPFAQAVRIFRGEATDVAVSASVLRYGDETVPLIMRRVSFFEREMFQWDRERGPTRLPLPGRLALHGLFGRRLIFTARQAWTHRDQTFAAGSLVAYHLDDAEAEVIFTPDDRQAIADVHVTKGSVVVAMIENVVGRVARFRRQASGWTSVGLALPGHGVVRFAGTTSSEDGFFVVFESMTQPQSLFDVSATDEVKQIRSLPAFYDASDVRVEQHFATSKDGTKVPYFVMGRSDVLDAGPAPTIQYGYGGFNVAILPVYYSDPSRPQHGALAGKIWVQRGGVMVLSTIRGGGGYGPKWHQSALKAHRQRAYDDFFAIAEDLVRRKVTTPKRLGAMGRSNGGLLMGVALTQRPDLYAAIDCGVPLFDMQRYDKLLAGASWVGEYGDPDDPAAWAYISQYSPYQALKPGQPYPEVLFYTSTKDDRVHPGHARRALAKMLSLGYPAYYYENIEGGHGGTANQKQLAMRTALEFAYFAKKLMPAPGE